MSDEGGFEIARAYMTVDADTGEAVGEVDELEERAANLHGTLTVDADISPAEAKLEELDASIEGRGATITVDADTAPAQESVAGVQAEAGSAHGTLTEDADTSPAQAKLEELDAAAKDATGTVTLGADAAPAEATLGAFQAQADATHADVTLGADVAPAEAELAALGDTGAAQAGLEQIEQHLDQVSGAADSAGESVAGLRNELGSLGNQAAAAGVPLADLSDKASVLDDRADALAGKLGTATGGIYGTAAALSGAGEDADAFGSDIAGAGRDIEGAGGDIDAFGERLASMQSKLGDFSRFASLDALGLGDVSSEMNSLMQEFSAFDGGTENAAADLESMAQRLDAVRDAMQYVYEHSSPLRAAMESLATESTHMGYAADEGAAAFDRVGGTSGQAAGDIEKAGDAAGHAAEQLGQAQTGARLLDDAMAKAGKGADAAWDATEALNLSLADTDKIGKAAREALMDLGATELEATAAANALVKAQREFDLLVTSGGGGGFAKGILGLLGGGGEGAGDLSSALSSVGALSAGIGVAYAFVAAMAEVGGIVTGVSAAFTGLVPAAALAIPAVEKISKALDDSRSKLEKLPPAERDTVEGIRELKSEYTKMADAFAPDVFKVFDEGVKVANNLLKDASPLADAAAGGIEHLLKQADKFTQSKGFKDWLKQITPDIAPSLEAIGGTIGTIALDWGKFMKHFSPQDIKNAFHILDDVINWWSTGWGHAITDVMTMWDDFSTAFKNVKTWIGDGVDGFKLFLGYLDTTFVPIVKHDMHDISNAVDVVREAYVHFGHDVEDAVDTVRETIVHVGHDIEAAWDKVAKDADDLKTDVVGDWDYLKDHVVEYADDLKNDVASDWDWLKTHVIQYADDIKNDVVTDWDYLKDHVIDAVHTTVHDVESTWDTAKSKVESTVDTLVHDVVTEFGKLPGQLVTLGKDAITGFIHGMEDMAGGIAREAAHLASLVPEGLSDILHFGSPSLLMREKGHDTMEGYRLGILDYEDPIVSAIKHVGSAAVSAGTTAFSSHGAPVPVASTIGHAPSAGGANVTVNLNGIMAFPNPEQLHAIQMALATAVGGAG
jgi:hypothetical protein